MSDLIKWEKYQVNANVDFRILQDAPNTYAYTKALAEGLVAEKMDTLPAIILRPSVSEYSTNSFALKLFCQYTYKVLTGVLNIIFKIKNGRGIKLGKNCPNQPY